MRGKTYQRRIFTAFRARFKIQRQGPFTPEKIIDAAGVYRTVRSTSNTQQRLEPLQSMLRKNFPCSTKFVPCFLLVEQQIHCAGGTEHRTSTHTKMAIYKAAKRWLLFTHDETKRQEGEHTVHYQASLLCRRPASYSSVNGTHGHKTRRYPLHHQRGHKAEQVRRDVISSYFRQTKI